MDPVALLIGIGAFCAIAAIAFPLTWSAGNVRTFTYSKDFDQPIHVAALDARPQGAALGADLFAPATLLSADTTAEVAPPAPDATATSTDAAEPRATIISFFQRRLPRLAIPRKPASPSATAEATTHADADADAQATEPVPTTETTYDPAPPPEPAVAIVTEPTTDPAPLPPVFTFKLPPLATSAAARNDEPAVAREADNAAPPATIDLPAAAAIDATLAVDASDTTVRPRAMPTPSPREGGDLSKTDTHAEAPMPPRNPLARIIARFGRKAEPVVAAAATTTDTTAENAPLEIAFAADAAAPAPPPTRQPALATSDADENAGLDKVSQLSAYMSRNRSRVTDAIDRTTERFVEDRSGLTTAYAWVRDAMQTSEPVTLDVKKRRRLLNLYGATPTEANAAMLRRIIEEDPELAPDAERLLHAIG